MKKLITAVIVVTILSTFLVTNIAFAAAETINCGSGGSRTLTVGTYTNSDGSSFTSGADLTLSQGGGAACTFTINLDQDDAAISLASLTIESGVTLTHDAPGIVAGVYNRLNFDITGALDIQSGGAIDVTAKGYLGAHTTGNTSADGYGDGNTVGSQYSSAGSHGGNGGYTYSGITAEAYDSVSDPVQPGGGGAGGTFTSGGNGGGVVQIEAASATVNGDILALGDYSLSNFSGGAGGTINITLTGALAGSGNISASADGSSYGDAVGGGGRIAVKGYTSLDTNIVFDVSGGDSVSFSSGKDGASGTLFKKSSTDTYGHLVLDNGTSALPYYTTHLPYPVPTADQYAKYGGGYVFDSVTVSNYAELSISSSLDTVQDGSANFSRMFYSTDCTASDNDYSNGEIIYSAEFFTQSVENSTYDYVCSDPLFMVGFSTTSASAKENQTSKSFTVNANGVADGTTTVDYTVSIASTATATSDYILSSGQATIGIGESSDSISFTVVDDTDRESSETIVVTLSNPSGATLASSDTYTYTILDNDTPGVTLSTGGSTSVMEASTEDSYTVVLDTQPTANVVITPAGDADVTTSPSTLTFTTLNWDTPQEVTVTAVNDSIAEGSESATVSHTADSTDADYDEIDIDDVTVTVSDNDIAGAFITQSSYFTAVAEQGPTSDSYMMRLMTQPIADVTVSISTNGQCTLDTDTLVFTSVNWETDQTVTVTAVDDTDSDQYSNCAIAHSATSSDGQYNGVSINSIYVSITDNDTPGITLATSDNAMAEGGGTATYSYVLNSQPTDDVVIEVGIGTSSDYSLSTTTLTFTTSNWNTPQSVVATAIDDSDAEGSETMYPTASTTSNDSGYNGIYTSNPSLSIYDNDLITLTESSGSTNVVEGGATDSYTVVLTSELTYGTVEVTVTPSGQCTVDDSTLTFTTGIGLTPQTVTVTAVDDLVAEGNHTCTITYAVTDSTYSTYYNAVINDTVVNVTDNDEPTAGITVTESSSSTDVTEGSTTDSFTVVLDSQPAADVVITLTDDSDVTLSTNTLTFTSSNWDTPQTVTVTGYNDAIDENTEASSVSFSVDSTDGDYDAFSVTSVTVNITDNDTAGITVGTVSGNTSESGSTATFTLVLNSEPTGTVNIGVSSSDTTEGTVSPSSATFNSGNWSTPQTITITGVDDSLDDGNIAYTVVVAAAISSDGNYSDVNPSDVSLSNTDNDIAGITVGAISGNTTETGSTATFTVVLDSQPTSDVTIAISSSDTTEGTVSSSSLTFTSSNWSTPQTITVTGVNDYLDDGNITYSISTGAATSSDDSYSGVDPSNLSLSNTDNDTSGVTVSTISGNTTEAGGTATFTVVLDSQPTSDVTIAVSSSDTGEGTVSPSTLTFTSSNWSTPQTVTLTGADDSIDDGGETYSIALAITTDDTSGYSGMEINSVNVTNNDNDTSGITVDYTTGSTDEAGTTQRTFTVVLESEPTADVTIPISSSDTTEGTVSTSTLTFTNTNWNIEQSITITGTDDLVDDGDVIYSILLGPATSNDDAYDGVTLTSLEVTSLDDDETVTTQTVTDGVFFLNIVHTAISDNLPDNTDSTNPTLNGVEIEEIQTDKLKVSEGLVSKTTALVNEEEKTRVVIKNDTEVTLENGEVYEGKIEVPTVINESEVVSSTGSFNESYGFVNAVFVNTHAQHIFFSKPVVVTVPLENLDINPEKMEVWTYNEELATWQKLQTKIVVNYGKRTINFEVSKFSYVAVLQNQYFDDTEHHWAGHYILELTKAKVVKGVTKNNFEPDRQISRAELVKIALLGFGYTVEENLDLRFTDVKESDWSHDYIATAVKKGFIKGYEDGSFKPDNMVTRAEALKIILKAARADLKIVGTAFKMMYSDVNSKDWYFPYLRFAAYEEIVDYQSGESYRPNEGITRAEAAKLTVETKEYKDI